MDPRRAWVFKVLQNDYGTSRRDEAFKLFGQKKIKVVANEGYVPRTRASRIS